MTHIQITNREDKMNKEVNIRIRPCEVKLNNDIHCLWMIHGQCWDLPITFTIKVYPLVLILSHSIHSLVTFVHILFHKDGNDTWNRSFHSRGNSWDCWSFQSWGKTRKACARAF